MIVFIGMLYCVPAIKRKVTSLKEEYRQVTRSAVLRKPDRLLGLSGFCGLVCFASRCEDMTTAYL
jgi:hypothetical protein